LIAAHDDSTLCGVYKRANQGTAAVYLADHGLASVGLRPHTVFGPGPALPFPAEADGTALEAIIGPVPRTAFDVAVCDLVERFGDLLDRGLVAPPDA